MRVLLTGGGSGGPVTPLLAIAREIKKRDSGAEFLFIGTKNGSPEQELAKNAGLFYRGIRSGKLRRYFSWRNFFDPILLTLGVIESIFIIKKFKPNIILSAGSFVSVPVVWAGWLMRVPSLIHQQDIMPSLSNVMMSSFARAITVSLGKSLADFPKKKTALTGNPVRPEILEGDKMRAIKTFNLESNLPTLLVVGGGTGAKSINEIIYLLVPELTKFCQIIHLTGRNKLGIRDWGVGIERRYHLYEFLSQEMAEAYAVADLVISRAGMNALSELSALAKPAILIPIPGSHQEANAKYFADKKAAYVLWPKYLTADFLFKKVRELISDQNELGRMRQNIAILAAPDAGQKIVDQIYKICYNE